MPFMQFPEIFRKEQAVLYRQRCRLFFLCHFQQTSGFADKFSLLDEPVAFYAIIVFLPDVLIFAAPATHKVLTQKSIASTVVTCSEVATAQVKQPYRMAVNTLYITKAVA